MHSTEVQAKPLFSWKALGWALLYFWFFSTLLQAIIYISGYSGTNGIRDSLCYSARCGRSRYSSFRSGLKLLPQ